MTNTIKAKLQIENWHPKNERHPSVPTRERRYRILPRLLGAFGTVALHGIALAMLLGFRGHPRLPSILRVPPADLFFLNLENATPNHSQQAMVLDGDSLKNIRIDPPILAAPVAHIPNDILDEAPGNEASLSDEALKRARLAGMYSRQILARIERVWRRPRTPIFERNGARHSLAADETFRCAVTIVQDTQGDVLETLLTNCQGSESWRQSLVRAINQASPLPSPPDEKIFTARVTLEFVGFNFDPRFESDEYETSN